MPEKLTISQVGPGVACCNENFILCVYTLEGYTLEVGMYIVEKCLPTWWIRSRLTSCTGSNISNLVWFLLTHLPVRLIYNVENNLWWKGVDLQQSLKLWLGGIHV